MLAGRGGSGTPLTTDRTQPLDQWSLDFDIVPGCEAAASELQILHMEGQKCVSSNRYHLFVCVCALVDVELCAQS